MSQMRRQINTLLLSIKAGNKPLMTELIDLTYNHLKYLVLHYTCDKRYYKDVLDEVYLKVYTCVNGFNAFKDGYDWLCKIVRNTAIDFNKKDSRYITCEKADLDVFNFNDEADELLKEDVFYQTVKTFSKLDRQIVYLGFVLDLPPSQIAKQLGQDKTSVLHRMEMIAEKLNAIHKR